MWGEATGIEMAGAALQPFRDTRPLPQKHCVRRSMWERPCVAKGAQSAPSILENYTAIGAVIGAWCS